ncbi:hypothetical protein [Nonomuraea guangzhouensis]|uniref:Antibiotic biosynthesis monooxygenase n=1 Tax=Nonomuraea guangzhouensis TaxID=1291555 RepID=A0ABW4GGX8_9ACTN|nr:hypothetical protein [Nonomuraea guangzhouensis]
MTKRRDVFIFVSEPGKTEQAQDYLGEFLRSLDGHPGYLGGSVLKECAGELLPGTLVLLLDFASTEAARALWPKIENTVNPLYPDDKTDKSPDQGAAFFNGTGDAASPLTFSRGNGLLARMLHVHAAAVDEFATV